MRKEVLKEKKFEVGDTVICVAPLEAFDIKVGETLTISSEESKKLFEMTAGHWDVLCNDEKEPYEGDDLEKAANAFGKRFVHVTNQIIVAFGFRKGAEWQKRQMMKGAVEAEIFDNYDKDICQHHLEILAEVPVGYTDGDKVKLIITKED